MVHFLCSDSNMGQKRKPFAQPRYAEMLETAALEPLKSSIQGPTSNSLDSQGQKFRWFQLTWLEIKHVMGLLEVVDHSIQV